MMGCVVFWCVARIVNAYFRGREVVYQPLGGYPQMGECRGFRLRGRDLQVGLRHRPGGPVFWMSARRIKRFDDKTWTVFEA